MKKKKFSPGSVSQRRVSRTILLNGNSGICDVATMTRWRRFREIEFREKWFASLLSSSFEFWSFFDCFRYRAKIKNPAYLKWLFLKLFSLCKFWPSPTVLNKFYTTVLTLIYNILINIWSCYTKISYLAININQCTSSGLLITN